MTVPSLDHVCYWLITGYTINATGPSDQIHLSCGPCTIQEARQQFTEHITGGKDDVYFIIHAHYSSEAPIS